MPTSRFPEISDELLSAYIDHAVSEAERRLVEEAVQQDVRVAWRLGTLTETVQLLRSLPLLTAPRSFVLTPEQTSQPVRPAATTEDASSHQPLPRWKSWLEGWRRFWQGAVLLWQRRAGWQHGPVAVDIGLCLPLGSLPAPCTSPPSLPVNWQHPLTPNRGHWLQSLKQCWHRRRWHPCPGFWAGPQPRARRLWRSFPLPFLLDGEAQPFPGWLAGVQGGLAGAVLLSALGWWRSRRSA
jgi:hypothetical protein